MYTDFAKFYRWQLLESYWAYAGKAADLNIKRRYFLHPCWFLSNNACQNIDNCKMIKIGYKITFKFFISELEVQYVRRVECKAESTLPILWGVVKQKNSFSCHFPIENQPIFGNKKNRSEKSGTLFWHILAKAYSWLKWDMWHTWKWIKLVAAFQSSKFCFMKANSIMTIWWS